MAAGNARVVAGRYRIVRPLGQGGMGAVWQAHDTLLGRDVAIKEIWFPSAAEGPVDPADPLLRRALREAQAAARLRHPGIVTVHDVVMESGRPWIVMELVDGESLAQAIRAHGLLTAERTASIGLHVLDALRAAHREGIAHRDVKPANILLDTDRVVLTDFGIAAIDDATALTATGQMVGSPAYLAPERVNGRPATPASDLWSLGVTLYAAVTGRSPFQREDTQATFAAILHARPETPAHAGRLWPAVKGLLEKDPARRLTDAQVRPLLANAAQPAPATTSDRRPRWWAPRPRRPEPETGGIARTVNAPPPTVAAPTAHQPPAPAAASAASAGTPRAETATSETVPTATPTAEAAPAQTPAAEQSKTATATAETPTAETATAGTLPADTAAARTPTADTTTPGTAGAAETAAAETAAPGTGTTEAAAPPAEGRAASEADPETAATIPAGAGPIEWPTPLAVPAGAAPLATIPLVPRDAGRVAPARSRSGWLVAAAAVAVLLVGAGVALRIAWPDAGGADGPAGRTDKKAALTSPAPRSPSPSPANPTLDGCLVGRWRMTSVQVKNTFEDKKTRFTGKGGVLVRIWPDGKEIDDYNRSAPLTATINGHKYVEWLRGVETMHTATKGGRVYTSDITDSRTVKVTRDGRTIMDRAIDSPGDSLPYICSETTMTTYGDESNVSTQSFQRVSHTP